MSGIKIAFGTGGFGRGFDTVEAVEEIYTILESHKVKILDTATLYAGSEELIGKTKGGSRFIIDTKSPNGVFGHAGGKEGIVENFKKSRKDLGQDQVDIWYLHSPSKETPLEETLEAVNEAYKAGFFKRFGLSNFFAEEVQRAYDICKAKYDFVPTVYQGNYNAVARKQETLLFPTLRKLGIAFYAYSPVAGGFLTKTKQDVLDGKGRFNPDTPIGKMYAGLYSRPAYLEALAKWEAAAKEEGVTRAELANRWVRFNSALKPEQGDAIIIGASSTKQLKETLSTLDHGPLSDKAVKAINAIWEEIKHEAPLDNMNGANFFIITSLTKPAHSWFHHRLWLDGNTEMAFPVNG
ncbi:hypothetical protein B0A48_08784 [Cryoendolithus antarcticus]|uniref:NADP-dependent oxidoreductase domain-containing protein n=1 Tax=Cryoendolithus antarcticus TaxID=1507870 RepID=A0A1V8T463_9PEZI|nr:hypothetical protein B0A48_08784 [Cryoendolithus antarcticus]